MENKDETIEKIKNGLIKSIENIEKYLDFGGNITLIENTQRILIDLCNEIKERET